MAFLLNTPIASRLRSHTQIDSFSTSNRAYHVELGAREKALLAEDPALMNYKSTKKNVRRLKRFGDVLIIVTVAGCCYEIYVRAVMREEARKAKGGVITSK